MLVYLLAACPRKDTDTTPTTTDTDASNPICVAWQANIALSDGQWNGDAATCDAGDMTPGRDNALTALNMYRDFAGMPEVSRDPTWDDGAQQCALIRRENDNLVTTATDTDWTCLTTAGADAWSRSLVASGPAVAAVHAFMTDPQTPSLGHRRLLLGNGLGPIGIGATDETSCIEVLGATGNAGIPFTAWPPPGDFPYEAMIAIQLSPVDSTGWSIQSDTIDLSAASVAVTVDGADQPVTTTILEDNVGSRYALSFVPDGWHSAPHTTYHVEVSGVSTPISYDVTLLGCSGS